MLRVQTLFIALSFFAILDHTAAQDCNRLLKGQVRTAENLAPLPYADILIRAINLRTQTDEQGWYTFEHLCADSSYLLEVHYLNRMVKATALPRTVHLDVEMPSDSLVLQTILVTARQLRPVVIAPVHTLSNADIAAQQVAGLTELVRQLPGVNALQTGANISKPVIEGLHSNRIALVSNGIILESQQWGREHAPELDAFSAQRISVVKGAMGVKYGVGAMGGAIVMEPEPLRKERGFGGWAVLGGFSNGRSVAVASAVDYRAKNEKWAARLQSTLKRGGNLHAPDYWLYNTGHAEYNVAAMAEWKPSLKWRHEVSFSRVAQRLGVLRASHLGNVEQILQAAQLDTPMNNINRFTWAIDRPFQRVEHYTGSWKTHFRPNDHLRLSAIFNHQFNHRREYDIVRSTGAAAERPQVSFRLWTNTLDVQAAQLGHGYWRAEGGVQLSQATNYVNRGAFIPDYITLGASAWAIERWRNPQRPFELEAGARYDFRWSHATTEGNSNRNLNEKVRFANMSGTLGAHYHIGERSVVTLHSGYAWRPPSLYELFAQGVHHGAGIFEQGDSNLVSEKAWNNHLSFRYNGGEHGWSISASVYVNRIRDFIYLDPQNTVRITIRGPFPAYYYRQADAVLKGGDLQVAAPLWHGFFVDTKAALLWGDRRVTDPDHPDQYTLDPLPLMPANRFQYGLRWQKTKVSARVFAHTVLRQQRIPAAGLLKAAPDGFTLLGCDVLYSFSKRGYQWEIGVTGQNLTQVRYREYLNFFRFYADEPGTNVGVRAKVRF